MKILLCQPRTPTTFWSFEYALPFISKKTSEPPLGLLTVAALLPDTWKLKLVDMNVTELCDEHIQWADYVFITGMNVHSCSMKEIVHQCNIIGTKVVAGGPFCTLDYLEMKGVSHFILNEAEITLTQFIKDVETNSVKRIYSSDAFPDLSSSPVPMWSLVDMSKYSTMTIQYSRGCPFNCEFCGISRLNGAKPRTKSRKQLISELNALYDRGWHSGVFIVDDNFIGHKKKLKTDILPAITEWQKRHNFPFSFMTEVSINLADDDELIKLLVDAGFDSTFIGIETPVEKSLQECAKRQNQKRNLLASVKKLQHAGLTVSGGFIVGFDHDPVDIFQQQINFIQQSGIATAMVGLLNAPTGTRLYERMEKENRLTGIMSGDNTDASMNFIPKMKVPILRDGYQHILKTIYSPAGYLDRIKNFLRVYRLPTRHARKMSRRNFSAFFKAVWFLGIVRNSRLYFWRLLAYCIFHYPRKIPIAIELAIYGFHFEKVTEHIFSKEIIPSNDSK